MSYPCRHLQVNWDTAGGSWCWNPLWLGHVWLACHRPKLRPEGGSRLLGVLTHSCATLSLAVFCGHSRRPIPFLAKQLLLLLPRFISEIMRPPHSAIYLIKRSQNFSFTHGLPLTPLTKELKQAFSFSLKNVPLMSMGI